MAHMPRLLPALLVSTLGLTAGLIIPAPFAPILSTLVGAFR